MNSLKDKIEAIDKLLENGKSILVSLNSFPVVIRNLNKARTLLAELKRELEPQANVIKSVCDICDSTTDRPTYKLCDKHYAEYEKFKQTVL